MLSTRFVFVEGIIGSGKTTTAEFLTDRLRQASIPARFLAEGPTVDKPEHPLRVATTLPHPNAVWRDATVEEYIELSLGKWRAFASEAERAGSVTVCDGLLFHGNMTDLMLMDEEPPVLRRYVERVLESIRALDPAVVYLRREDVARALREVCDERGAGWEEYQVGWKVASPYGARRGLRGFDGLVELYREYMRICDGIFAGLALPKLAIRNQGDWQAYNRDILTFLGLPETPHLQGEP